MAGRVSLMKNKYLATVASIWIQCTSGSLYTFSIYSQVLKSSQSYDQSTLDTVSVFKDFGGNVGILSGLLYDAVAARPMSPTAAANYSCGHGPWLVLLVGTIQCFCGYLLMWLAVTDRISRPPVAVMCLIMVLAAQGATFLNTANVVTAVRNFPSYSGTSVGIMKGFLGLSGAILIQIYQTAFNNKPSSFLLMLALFPTFNTLLFMSFVRILDSSDVDEKRHLNSFSVVSLIVAVYLMAVIIIKKNFTLELPVHMAITVVLLLLLASPLYIAIKAQPSDLARVPLIEENQIRDDPSRWDDKGPTHDEVANLNLFQAMWTSNFWFLCLTTACGVGSGLATVNNISQIGESLGYKTSETSTLVSLLSIWNFLGRFGAGYISDYFLHRKGWSRPLFVAITLAAMSIGHSVIASGLPTALYTGSLLVGVCYGSQWSLMPAISSEIFGVAHFGTIFNTISIAGPLGSYVFSVRVVGYIYDKEASSLPIGSKCMGTHCFRLAFFIMASTTFVGSLVALGFFYRTRTLYTQVIAKRLRRLG